MNVSRLDIAIYDQCESIASVGIWTVLSMIEWTPAIVVVCDSMTSHTIAEKTQKTNETYHRLKIYFPCTTT